MIRFRSGTLALSLFLLSGCRLGNLFLPGNSNSNSYSSGRSSDGVSGYYVAEPQTLKFYATQTNTIEKDASLDQIPALIGQYISNPVALILQDPSTGQAAFTTPQGSQGFPTNVDSNLKINFLGTTQPKLFWMDPACKKHLEVSESGQVIRSNQVVAPFGNKLPLAGKIELTIQVIYQFEGDCTASFSAIHLCYLDSNQCGGSDSKTNSQLQAIAVKTFAPWIDSQTIQVSDIPYLTQLSYEVSYQ